jgi:hypothetical protein
MRITKLPIPLLIAAAALTGVAVIYVYLTAPPMPIYTDPNFTTPLYVGGVYLWRGAAFEYTFSSDEIISISYMPPYHLIYTTGPLTNTTVGSNVWVVYVRGERPLYVIKLNVYLPWAGYSADEYFVFKLTDVTPSNVTGLNMWLPETFGRSDFLSTREYNAVLALVSNVDVYRAINVVANSTHLIIDRGDLTYDNVYRVVVALPSPQSGRTIRVTNEPISSSYVINSTTYTIIALPYQYFSISPTATTNLVIYVS